MSQSEGELELIKILRAIGSWASLRYTQVWVWVSQGRVPVKCFYSGCRQDPVGLGRILHGCRQDSMVQVKTRGYWQDPICIGRILQVWEGSCVFGRVCGYSMGLQM